MSDQQFRIGVLAGGSRAGRWHHVICGSAGACRLPPKPPAPTGPSGTQTAAADEVRDVAAVYQHFLEVDATTAGVRAPSLEEMSRKLAVSRR